MTNRGTKLCSINVYSLLILSILLIAVLFFSTPLGTQSYTFSANWQDNHTLLTDFHTDNRMPYFKKKKHYLHIFDNHHTAPKVLTIF